MHQRVVENREPESIWTQVLHTMEVAEVGLMYVIIKCWGICVSSLNYLAAPGMEVGFKNNGNIGGEKIEFI